MPEAAWLLLALGACYLGFAGLALSQRRHWQRVAGGGQAPVRPLRLGGGLGVAAGLVLAVLRDGPAFGALLWGLLLAVAATAVALTLTWRPTWLGRLARVARYLTGAA